MMKKHILNPKNFWIFFLKNPGKPLNSSVVSQKSPRARNRKLLTLFKFCKTNLFFMGFLGLSFFSSFSYAGAESFPTKEIFIQVFNFSVFAGAFIFLTRKPIKLFFHRRQEEFFAFEKQAAQWERERQEEFQTWERKLEILKEQEAGIKQKAQTEGERFIVQKQEEIKNLKARLKKELDFFLRLEKEKSKRNLLIKWKRKVVQKAGLELEKQAQSTSFQQDRLKDFFKQMEAHL